jgi:hypothetical protein
MESGWCPNGLPIRSRVGVCEAERPGTNHEGMGGATTLGESRERWRLLLKKDGTRLIRAGQLRKEAQGAACKGRRCFNTPTLPRRRL